MASMFEVSKAEKLTSDKKNRLSRYFKNLINSRALKEKKFSGMGVEFYSLHKAPLPLRNFFRRKFFTVYNLCMNV